MRNLSFVAVVVSTLMAGPAAGTGDPCGRPLVSLTEENDSHWVSRVSGSDRHYTQGLRLAASWDSPAGCLSPLRDLIPKSLLSEGPSRSGLVLGQNMYTPSDISQPDPIERDRPYAAWLYVGASFEAIGVTGQRHTFELDVGVVGPLAHGEQAQTFVHRVIGVGRPRGWAHQLGNEPGVVVRYMFDRRVFALGPRRAERLGADGIFRAGGSIGNVFTNGSLGATLRLGWNLPDELAGRIDAVPLNVSPGLAPSAAPPRPPFWEAYLFASVDGRYVLRNIFLDGNTLRESRSITKEPFVSEIEWGFAARASIVRLVWRQVRRSSEFRLQRAGDIYGSLTLQVDLRMK